MPSPGRGERREGGGSGFIPKFSTFSKWPQFLVGFGCRVHKDTDRLVGGIVWPSMTSGCELFTPLLYTSCLTSSPQTVCLVGVAFAKCDLCTPLSPLLFSPVTFPSACLWEESNTLGSSKKLAVLTLEGDAGQLKTLTTVTDIRPRLVADMCHHNHLEVEPAADRLLNKDMTFMRSTHQTSQCGPATSWHIKCMGHDSLVLLRG